MQSYFSILVVYLYQRLFQWWPFLKENTLLCIQFGKEIQQDSMNIENLVTRLRETWVKNYKLNSIIDILKASSGGINKMIFFFEKYHIFFFFFDENLTRQSYIFIRNYTSCLCETSI